jgi:hypothetical protein
LNTNIPPKPSALWTLLAWSGVVLLVAAWTIILLEFPPWK